MYSSASRTDIQPWGWRRRVRRLHLRHLWFLRLNDWTLECTRCGATKEETRMLQHATRAWKAIAAGVSSGLAAWAVADQAGDINGGQLWAIVLAAAGVAVTTWLAPRNTEPI